MSTEKADTLYTAAVRVHSEAYAAAKLLATPEARQAAYQEADRVFDLQREHQRKVRHGEVQSRVAWTVEGRNEYGQWLRSQVGDDSANRFASREAAEAELTNLATVLDCDVSELRVVEAQS